MKILVINSGSSSIKYKFFDMPRELCVSKGVIENIGEKDSKIADHYSGLRAILKGASKVDVIGHRVVHGGEEFKQPALVDSLVIKKIKQRCVFAPLHNPANLLGVLACKRLLPGVRQVAVFDTAFHHSLPEYAYIYGLPYEYYKRLGIRKYGFHGSSHQYVASEAARILNKPLNKIKIITCHLGNGCSISAVSRGKSIDTSMGFTPLEGLVMGTRCGDIDPALVTYIMKKRKLDIPAVEDILNKDSGLKGISGISNDMRVIGKKIKAGNARAKLAVDIFIYRIKKYIGSYMAVMSGADALVFTGGIGENQRRIRRQICQGLFSYLKKPPKVLVVPTNEELMIARQAYRLVRNSV